MIPLLRGRMNEAAPLAPQTWFRVGGPAEYLVRPADVEDLCAFLKDLPLEVPLTVIGAASNLIIRDGGINGVVIKLARGFSDIEFDGESVVVGAAVLDITLSEAAAAEGLSGFEFLSGIPGSIGGAVAMNAGAYSSDISDILEWCEILTRDGEIIRLDAAALQLSYRHSMLPAGSIIVRARLRGKTGDQATIKARMQEIKSKRETTQPVRARTGGSTFANPPDMKAWELIDAAGCRGLRHGGAQVSPLHCNFLLNSGDATASDLESLGETVRKRVAATSGVSLQWEIKRLGVPA